MSGAIKAGVGLAVVVAILSVIFAATGMHEAGILPGLVLMVLYIALTIGAVFWTLKQTAAENGYGKQLLNVVVFGLVAGVLICVFSILNLNVFFPSYLEENTTAMVEFFESTNMPEEALQAQVEKLEARTAWRESMNGGIGTFVTSLVIGAIVAIFKRKK
jgi:nitrogen fixation/metabolism regulation signal transduction histidine kinase